MAIRRPTVKKPVAPSPLPAKRPTPPSVAAKAAIPRRLTPPPIPKRPIPTQSLTPKPKPTPLPTYSDNPVRKPRSDSRMFYPKPVTRMPQQPLVDNRVFYPKPGTPVAPPSRYNGTGVDKLDRAGIKYSTEGPQSDYWEQYTVDGKKVWLESKVDNGRMVNGLNDAEQTYLTYAANPNLNSQYLDYAYNDMQNVRKGGAYTPGQAPGQVRTPEDSMRQRYYDNEPQMQEQQQSMAQQQIQPFQPDLYRRRIESMDTPNWQDVIQRRMAASQMQGGGSTNPRILNLQAILARLMGGQASG